MRAVSKGIIWRSPSSPALPFLCFYPLSISFLTLAQTLSSRGPSLAFSNQTSAIDAPHQLILLDQNLTRLCDPDPQSAPAIVGQLREFYYAPGIKPDDTDFEEDKKRAFLQRLAFHIERKNDASTNLLQLLASTQSPGRDQESGGSYPQGLPFIIDIRADLLKLLKTTSDPTGENSNALRNLEAQLKAYLVQQFSPRSLSLQKITSTSPLNVLENVMRNEKVHPVFSLEELKQRLAYGKRCFAYFHNTMPQQPLAIVHTSLEPQIASSMKEIRRDTASRVREEEAKAAMFYSIVSTQKGLKGIDLGFHLIKGATKQLHGEFPRLEHFVTLSPIPNFRSWLGATLQTEDNAFFARRDWARPMIAEKAEFLKKLMSLPASLSATQTLLTTLESMDWYTNEEVCRVLQPLMLRLCAHYLVNERRPTANRSSTAVLDKVANFHLSNGAYVHRINWLGDLSRLRIRESAGMMVNYYYETDFSQEEGGGGSNQQNGGFHSQKDPLNPYLTQGIVKVSKDVEFLLKDRW